MFLSASLICLLQISKECVNEKQILNKNISCLICLRKICALLRNGSNICFGDYGVKELVTE